MKYEKFQTNSEILNLLYSFTDELQYLIVYLKLLPPK